MSVHEPSRRLNVLFLSDHLGHADGRIHGATSYFLSVLPRLNRDMFHLTVCFLREHHDSASLLEDRGVSPLFLNRGKWDFSVVFDLKRLIGERGIDVVHAAGMKGILTGRWAAHRCGARCLIHLHDMVPQPFPIRFLQRRMASWTDRALVISEAVRHYAIEEFLLPADRVITLHNGIDLDRFVPFSPGERRAMRASHDISEDAPVVSIIGRFDANKNHALAIRAFRGVADALPTARLLIIGAGPLESTLRAMVGDLALDGQVRFLGQRTDVPDLLGISDVLLITSRSEGLGLTAIEALATGVPVVCPDLGGLREVVEDGVCGYLTTPENGAEFTEGLLRLLREGETRAEFSRAARERSKLFDIRRHVKRLESVYLESVEGHA